MLETGSGRKIAGDEQSALVLLCNRAAAEPSSSTRSSQMLRRRRPRAYSRPTGVATPPFLVEMISHTCIWRSIAGRDCSSLLSIWSTEYPKPRIRARRMPRSRKKRWIRWVVILQTPGVATDLRTYLVTVMESRPTGSCWSRNGNRNLRATSGQNSRSKSKPIS